MDTIEWLGSLLLTVCAIPQVIKVYRESSAEGLSWAFLLSWSTGLGLTAVYATDKLLLPLAISCFVNLLSATYIIYVKSKNLTWGFAITKTQREAKVNAKILHLRELMDASDEMAGDL